MTAVLVCVLGAAPWVVISAVILWRTRGEGDGLPPPSMGEMLRRRIETRS
jgi:hypothetical protein